jgi:glycosyltransferase involved in cell wall biosynthesis
VTLDLSVAMLVRNPPIDRVVALIDYMSVIASEFIIVDTGSDNETIGKMMIMNKAPWSLPKVKVIKRKWRDDFAWARNEGLNEVTRKWTLVLDPDELPSFKMMEHIKDVITVPRPDAIGWLHLSVNYTGGIRDPFQEFHWHVRLFESVRGRFYRPLDELVSLDGRAEHDTRGTPLLPKAPREAYLIHSKDTASAKRSADLYDRMRREGKFQA